MYKYTPWNKGKIFSHPKLCKVDGCGKSAHYKEWGKKGFCANHIALLRRNGKPERVKGSPGSGYISRGCKFVRVAGKQIPEHRHVMEKHLGRKLKPFPEEIVHHVKILHLPANLIIFSYMSTSGIAPQQRKLALFVLRLKAELNFTPTNAAETVTSQDANLVKSNTTKIIQEKLNKRMSILTLKSKRPAKLIKRRSVTLKYCHRRF